MDGRPEAGRPAGVAVQPARLEPHGIPQLVPPALALLSGQVRVRGPPEERPGYGALGRPREEEPCLLRLRRPPRRRGVGGVGQSPSPSWRNSCATTAGKASWPWKKGSKEEAVFYSEFHAFRDALPVAYFCPLLSGSAKKSKLFSFYWLNQGRLETDLWASLLGLAPRITGFQFKKKVCYKLTGARVSSNARRLLGEGEEGHVPRLFSLQNVSNQRPSPLKSKAPLLVQDAQGTLKLDIDPSLFKVPPLFDPGWEAEVSAPLLASFKGEKVGTLLEAYKNVPRDNFLLSKGVQMLVHYHLLKTTFQGWPAPKEGRHGPRAPRSLAPGTPVRASWPPLPMNTLSEAKKRDAFFWSLLFQVRGQLVASGVQAGASRLPQRRQAGALCVGTSRSSASPKSRATTSSGSTRPSPRPSTFALGTCTRTGLT